MFIYTASCQVSYYGNSAASVFRGTPVLGINGVSYANAYDRTVSPGVWYPGRQLTVSNLDLPVNAGGFGGLAIGDNGAVFSSNAQSETPINYLLQSSWFIDPQSSFGGNDENDGLTSSTPVKTWKEIIRRFGGTTSPFIAQDTSFTFLSSHIDNSDPVIFTPYSSGANITIQGTLTNVVSSGVFSGTIQQNIATGQLWETNITSPLSGTLLHFPANPLTNGYEGYAWVWKVPSINTAILSQPLVLASNIFDFPTGSSDALLPIGDGYSYTAYSLINVNLVKIGLTSVLYGNPSNFTLSVSHLNIFDPSGAGKDDLAVGQYVSFVECKCDRFLYTIYNDGTGTTTDALNVWLAGGYHFSNSSIIIGGVLSETLASDSQISGSLNGSIEGVIIDSNLTLQTSNLLIGRCYLPAGKILHSYGTVDSFGELPVLGDSFLWGQGSVDIRGNYVFTNTAQHHFQQSGNLTLNGKSMASAFDANNIGTFIDGISLTPFNLDLPVIQGGFGGTALIPNGGTITVASDGYGFAYRSTDTGNFSYFIDPSNVSLVASDLNDGLTNTTPILTIKELNRRYKNRVISSVITNTFMSNVLPGDDLLDIPTSLGVGGQINYIGTKNIVHAGALTSGTIAINPSVNQRQVLEDTSLGANGWSNYIGYFISGTSGTSDGYDAWLVKTDGTASLDLAFATRGYNFDSGLVGYFNSGDTYEISIGSDMLIGNISPKVLVPPQAPGDNGITFKDFNFLPTGGMPLIVDNTRISFTRCKFSDPFATAYGNQTTNLYNCNLGNSPLGPPSINVSTQGIQSTSSSGIAMYAGLYNSYQGDFCQFLSLFYDVYITGWGITIDPGLIVNVVINSYDNFIGGIQVQDTLSPLAAITINKTTSLTDLGQFNGDLIWGNGNAGYGVLIYPGITFTVNYNPLTTPIITGTLGDFAFLTTNGSVATVGRAWNESSGTWTSTINTTWSNFIAPIGTGFNYNAHYVANNSAIVGI